MKLSTWRWWSKLSNECRKKGIVLTRCVDQSSDHWITGWLLVLSCFRCGSCGKIAASLAKREASCSLTRLTVLYLVYSFVGLFFHDLVWSWVINPDSFSLERLKSPPTSMSSRNRAIFVFYSCRTRYITYTSFHQTTQLGYPWYPQKLPPPEERERSEGPLQGKKGRVATGALILAASLTKIKPGIGIFSSDSIRSVWQSQCHKWSCCCNQH